MSRTEGRVRLDRMRTRGFSKYGDGNPMKMETEINTTRKGTYWRLMIAGLFGKSMIPLTNNS
jgi:hypothetical protein